MSTFSRKNEYSRVHHRLHTQVKSYGRREGYNRAAFLRVWAALLREDIVENCLSGVLAKNYVIPSADLARRFVTAAALDAAPTPAPAPAAAPARALPPLAIAISRSSSAKSRFGLLAGATRPAPAAAAVPTPSSDEEESDEAWVPSLRNRLPVKTATAPVSVPAPAPVGASSEETSSSSEDDRTYVFNSDSEDDIPIRRASTGGSLKRAAEAPAVPAQLPRPAPAPVTPVRPPHPAPIAPGAPLRTAHGVRPEPSGELYEYLLSGIRPTVEEAAPAPALAPVPARLSLRAAVMDRAGLAQRLQALRARNAPAAAAEAPAQSFPKDPSRSAPANSGPKPIVKEPSDVNQVLVGLMNLLRDAKFKCKCADSRACHCEMAERIAALEERVTGIRNAMLALFQEERAFINAKINSLNSL